MNPKLPITFNKSIEINDIHDFNCVGQDVLVKLVEDMAVDERFLHDSIHEETGARYFNSLANTLIENTRNRLIRLAQCIFPEDDLQWLELTPYNLIED